MIRDSNKIDDISSHKLKHDIPRISTLRGIIIDTSDEGENAFSSIRFHDFDNEAKECQIRRKLRGEQTRLPVVVSFRACGDVGVSQR
jgi:hypothetical protein